MFQTTSGNPQVKSVIDARLLKLVLLTILVGSLYLWLANPHVADSAGVALQQQTNSNTIAVESEALSATLWKMHMSAADTFLSHTDSHFSDSYSQQRSQVTGRILHLEKSANLSSAQEEQVTRLVSLIANYDGLLKQARDKGYPAGKQELLEADKIMHKDIIPLTLELEQGAASNTSLQLPSSSRYQFGLAILLLLLLGVQVYLARYTRRIFCLPLVAASILLLLSSFSMPKLTHSLGSAFASNAKSETSLRLLTRAQSMAYEACADCHFYLLSALEDPKFKKIFTDSAGHLTDVSVVPAKDSPTVAAALSRATHSMQEWRALQAEGTAFDSPAFQQEMAKHDIDFLTDLSSFENRTNNDLRDQRRDLSQSTAEFNATCEQLSALTWVPLLIAALVILGLQPKISRYHRQS